MKRRAYSLTPAGCPVEATLDAIGGKYKGMILYHLLDGPQRFGELRRLMPDVTQRMVTRQLRELEAAGLVHREAFPVIPPRVDYSLTEFGRSLEPILRLMQSWGIGYMGRIAESDLAGTSADREVADPGRGEIARGPSGR